MPSRGAGSGRVEPLVSDAERRALLKEQPLTFSQPRVDHTKIKIATRMLLEAIGEDPSREGLADTPRRVADFWREFIEFDAGRVDTTFEAVQSDQMVVVKGMRVWSLCEHHLLPFWCDVTCGYLAESNVLGLSKFARIAKGCARKLTLQEQLVADVAGVLRAVLHTQDVAVIAEGEHLCMTMRGIEMPHRMISSSLHGRFRNPEPRTEFLNLARSSR